MDRECDHRCRFERQARPSSRPAPAHRGHEPASDQAVLAVGV